MKHHFSLVVPLVLSMFGCGGLPPIDPPADSGARDDTPYGRARAACWYRSDQSFDLLFAVAVEKAEYFWQCTDTLRDFESSDETECFVGICVVVAPVLCPSEVCPYDERHEVGPGWGETLAGFAINACWMLNDDDFLSFAVLAAENNDCCACKLGTDAIFDPDLRACVRMLCDAVFAPL